MMERMHWQDGVTLVTGLALAVALFIFKVTPPEGGSLALVTWNFVLVGLAAAGVAVAGLIAYRVWEEWVAMGLGVWLMASPWVLGFSEISVATWIAVICGLIISGMGLLALQAPEA